MGGKQIGGFLEELRGECLDFWAYCKKEKGLRWFLAVCIVIFWGIKIVNNDIFIDSEIMSIEPYMLLHSWYGSKRFSLIFMKRFFHIIRLVPYLSNVLFAFALWSVMIFLVWCMTQWFSMGNKRQWAVYLFPAFFITAPSLAEQYAYTLQIFEMTCSIGICTVAAFCAGQAIYKEKSALWYVGAFGCLVWSLGSYQAFASFYIALILISFLGIYEQGREEKAFICGLKQVVLFLAGFAAYWGIATALGNLKGSDSSYVEAMFRWGIEDAGKCLNDIRNEFLLLYCGVAPVLYYRFFGVTVILCVILLVGRGRKRGFHKMGWYVLALVLLAFSPMFVSLLTGARTPVRGQLVFPLVFAFFAAALWTVLHGWIRERAAVGPAKPLCGILTAIFFYQAWIQGMNLVQLNQTLHDAFSHDVLTAERIYMDICRVADRGDMQNCRVVFVGTRDARLSGAAALGEAVGHSFFDFGLSDIGVANRVNGLYNVLGMNLGGTTPEEYQEALEAAKGKESWPDSESVFLLNEDCVVVKLSD